MIGVDWHPDAATEAALADYYRRLYQTAQRRPKFTETLTRVADWVADAARQADAVSSWDVPVRELVALAAAQSVWMSAGEDMAVERIVEDWTLLNRRRFHVERDLAVRGFCADPRTAAVLLKALQECASELSHINPSRVLLKGRTTPQGCTLVIGCPDHSFSQLNGSIMMQLLCEAAPKMSVYSPDRHAIGLNVKDTTRSGRSAWLAAVARSDLQADDYDAELARLIHDLKNEVTAARVASERPAGGRTERLEAELSSSRHLDAAAALASRLRDADMLYAAADLFGSTDLATFMQSYVSDQIRRLPAHIRILPPTLTPAVVAIEERALRAVLDNLIRNAAEAMVNGGDITLDYAASQADDIVLLELADSGEGIPDEVIEAFAAGKPIASSKREGSGLGLLGVRRILRRAGGDLEPAQHERGTAWLVTIPLGTVSDAVEAPIA